MIIARGTRACSMRSAVPVLLPSLWLPGLVGLALEVVAFLLGDVALDRA
jgi:hypothetical protein